MRVSRRHAVYELGDGLLLVFKPKGHRERAHAHAYRQRLYVVCGRLEVRTAAKTVRVEARRALTLRAGFEHATRALDDTWLVVETGARLNGPRGRAGTRRAPSARRRS
ncbi:MAG: cupin domain-containing protein [Candidatus Binatia bacterium]